MPDKTTMAVSCSAVFTAFSSSSVPGIEPQLDHRISQNTMEPEPEPEFAVKTMLQDAAIDQRLRWRRWRTYR
jgi:hypothetical protein